MPNIKSAIKRVKQTDKKTASNTHAKATMRSAVRKADVAIDNKEDNVVELVRHAVKLTDSAARKGLIHKNAATRQKARLTKKAL